MRVQVGVQPLVLGGNDLPVSSVEGATTLEKPNETIDGRRNAGNATKLIPLKRIFDGHCWT